MTDFRDRHNCPPCAVCSGVGWIDVHPAPNATWTVMPCRTCRPWQHRRWTEGHLASGHLCNECHDIREDREMTWSAVIEAESRPEPPRRRDLA